MMKFVWPIVLFQVLLSYNLYSQYAVDNEIANENEYTVLFKNNWNPNVCCYRIPSLAMAPNGDLLVCCDERVPTCDDLRSNEDINIVLRRSQDNGKTWTKIERIVDFPVGQSASDPSLIVDYKTNTVFLLYNYMNLKEEKNIYYLHLLKSTNNGENWSDPIDITLQISKADWQNDFKFITSGRGIQTQNGKLLHTLVSLQHGVHVFASDDHGESWYLIDQALKPGDESKVVELSDGSWMVNSRINGGPCRFVHISKDQGLSWESYADSSLIDPGCNAAILSTDLGDKSGKALLFVNANDPEQRKNLSWRISNDQGKNWSNSNKIYSKSSAYVEIEQISNGDIAILFEKDDYQEIVIKILDKSIFK